MSNPETRGNPALQAMTLIQQLEDKVREKNQIIDGLKTENEKLKMKLVAGYLKNSWGTLVACIALGAAMVIITEVAFSLWR